MVYYLDLQVLIAALEGILLKTINLYLVFDEAVGVNLLGSGGNGVEANTDLLIVDGGIFPGKVAFFSWFESDLQVIDNHAVFARAVLYEVRDLFIIELP